MSEDLPPPSKSPLPDVPYSIHERWLTFSYFGPMGFLLAATAVSMIYDDRPHRLGATVGLTLLWSLTWALHVQYTWLVRRKSK